MGNCCISRAATSGAILSLPCCRTEEAPINGVKLSYILNEFVVTNGGRDSFEGLSIADVKQHFIQPKTHKYRLSLCEVLQLQQHTAVGKSQVFISHAWSCLFLDLLDSLENHFKDDLDIIIWLDIFSINQIEYPNITDEWMDSFINVMKEIGSTVLVLSQWHNPLPLTRTWCLYEIYCTIKLNNQFDVAMSLSNTTLFFDDMRRDFEVINTLFATIDIKNSKSSDAIEQMKILNILERSISYDEVNSLIFDKIYDWVISMACRAKENEKDHNKFIEMTNALACLYDDKSIYSKAEDLYKECIDKCRLATGILDHSHRLPVMNNLASLYTQQGKYTLAESIYTDCILQSSKVFGENHPDTLLFINNLGRLHYNQGRFDKAEEYLLDCLNKSEEALGSHHPSTLTTVSNLAAVYYAQAKFKLSEQLNLECLNQRVNYLGIHHPDTIPSMCNLASLYLDQERYDEAEPLLLDSLHQSKLALGLHHPNTLAHTNNMALIYYKMGKFEKAKPLFESCIKQRKMLFGLRHPDTKTSLNNLANLYAVEGKFYEAELLYKECLQQNIRGRHHPDTLLYMNNLASLYFALQKYDKAEPLYLECINLSRTISGPDHPDTLRYTTNLANLYKTQGRYLL